MFGTFGVHEILIILVVGIILFGAAKLPKIVRSLAPGFKEYKRIKNVFQSGFDLNAFMDQDSDSDGTTRQRQNMGGGYQGHDAASNQNQNMGRENDRNQDPGDQNKQGQNK